MQKSHDATLYEKRLLTIRQIVGDTFTPISVKSVMLNDCDIERDDNHTHVSLCIAIGETQLNIKHSSIGIIEAIDLCLHEAVKNILSIDVPKLKLTSFRAAVERRSFNVESCISVELGLSCNDKTSIYIINASQSLLKASIRDIAKAYELLVNAPNALVILKKSITDAKIRNRNDLLMKYVSELDDVNAILLCQ